MLTKKQNLLETIRGGKPDRFVNQFSFMESPYVDPWNATNPFPWFAGDERKLDNWGITWDWPEGVIGAFPVHDEEHKALKDFSQWKDYVKAPSLDFTDQQWQEAKDEYAKIDRNEVFVGPTIFPGLFELLHSLAGMEEALMAFYTHPKEVREIIDYAVEWECEYIKMLAKHLQPDMVYHHDDWGSSKSTFMSPKMFKSFMLEPYKRLYKCYRDNGFELIIHHSDSFAATYVPFMIEMGVDIWQGATLSNDLPALIKQYGGQISFMAGIDTADVDRPDWTRELVAEKVRWACKNCGKHYFIPCQTQGGPMTYHEEVYSVISKEIDAMSKEMF